MTEADVHRKFAEGKLSAVECADVVWNMRRVRSLERAHRAIKAVFSLLFVGVWVYLGLRGRL